MASTPVSLCHAAVLTPEGVMRTPLPIRAGRIDAVLASLAYRVDLRDHLIFPGLINAHDHLHVNAVPPLPAHAPFPNSYAWIGAFQAHFQHPDVVAALQVPKALRMRHGALKNLLAGTTCVAHHDPWHPALDEDDFPVALLRDYGWSYALGWTDYGPPVRESFAATPVDRPWLIHLAEGTDVVADAELAQLDQLGCLAGNSVLIHGVGMSTQDIGRVIAQDAAVVWCPRSNLNLLGRTLDPRRLCAAGRLALGSDSRLSGARDLLDELAGIVDRYELDPTPLLALATTQAADILRMPSRGHLRPGAIADLVIVEDLGGDPARSMVGIERSQIRAVVRDGVPRIADTDFAEWFAMAGVETVPVVLDGKPKLLARPLADPALLALEPGLELSTTEHELAMASGSYP
ncbi:amidohydrolase family protein [Dyella nitratireducens]|uniref:amidohydrolase family protein n=1 Tax=Dyella nitratireducens TaxID=1849580 RepID=UPI003C2F835F